MTVARSQSHAAVAFTAAAIVVAGMFVVGGVDTGAEGTRDITG